MMPLTDMRDIIRSHNTFMDLQATQIQQYCQTAISELDKLLNA